MHLPGGTLPDTMTDDTLEAGLSRMTGRQVLDLSTSQLGVRNLIATPVEVPKGADRAYRSNDELWHALLNERLRATAVIRLENFWLSEWFPLRPGLFHTRRGRDNRERANRYLLTGPGVSPDALREFHNLFRRDISPDILNRFRLESTYVYSPHGKTMMLDGGVGCIRLKPKQLPAGQVWFMGATSKPSAHQGVPVALPDHLYQRFIDQIATEGSIRCTLTGQLRHVPPDFDPLYRGLVGIPQVYVLVDELEPSRNETDVFFIADGAVMVKGKSGGPPPEGTWDLADGIYAAFVSFLPRIPNAISLAAQWLADVYVAEVLGGRVLTDFDEQIRRFDGTTFSLEHVMGGRISTVDAEHLLTRCGASPHEVQQFIQRIEIVNGDVRNVNIVGSGNVVAGDGSAAAGPGGAAAAGTSAAATQGATAEVRHSSGDLSKSGENPILASNHPAEYAESVPNRRSYERETLGGHAFISYVREDSHHVDKLQRRLEEAGVRVWRDTADLWPGEDWRARIRRAINDNALAFIVCFSHASLARGKSYQNEELTLAIEQLRLRRPDDPWLFPVRFDDCDIPDRDIGGGRTLTSIQCADLFGDRSAEGVARLIAAVVRILGQQADADTAGLEESPVPVTNNTPHWLEKVDEASNVDTLIAAGEGSKIEFKSSLHHPYGTLPPDLQKLPSGQGRKQIQKALRKSITKTIAAFLNTLGGTLLIGVSDSGNVLGIEPDFAYLRQGKNDADGWLLSLKDVIVNALGPEVFSAIRVSLVPYGQQTVALIQCARRTIETWHREEGSEHFYIRASNATQELIGSSVLRYTREHWPA